MNKRQAKIEALHIASSFCSSCDMLMWDDDDSKQIEDQEKTLDALTDISNQLRKRAIKMESLGDPE